MISASSSYDIDVSPGRVPSACLKHVLDVVVNAKIGRLNIDQRWMGDDCDIGDKLVRTFTGVQ